jgi:hypothetical protein
MMLLHRWEILSPLAAAQALCKSSPETLSMPFFGHFFAKLTKEEMPYEQVEIIKSKIIELLPKAVFIKPTFESHNLNPDDFTEIFVEHQDMCIKKVRELMQQMKIK